MLLGSFPHATATPIFVFGRIVRIALKFLYGAVEETAVRLTTYFPRMKVSLTPVQLLILRRCSGGLRVWEAGADLKPLLSELATLCRLELVSFDVGRGYETTSAGEAWLNKFDG
jgi:hypothetical protein